MDTLAAWHELTPHPQTPCQALRGARVSLVRGDRGAWRAQFQFTGRMADLRIPQPTVPARVDELWRHFCAELFLMTPDSRYIEFNFAPSGCWAAYRFDGYRNGMAPAMLPADPVVTCRQAGEELQLDIALALPDDILAAAPLRIALCAMVEAADGTLSCWAARHAAGKPDFHHAGGFMPLAE